MKKFIMLCVLIPGLVFAKGPKPETEPNMTINFDEFPRVLHFDNLRNAISSNGEILFCPREIAVSWHQQNICSVENQNKWTRISDINIDGYTVDRYEFRLQNGYRHLFVYLKKK